MTDEWWKSKTKVGAVLVGGSLILGGCGKWLLEELNTLDALMMIGIGIGMIVESIGLRNALDKKK